MNKTVCKRLIVFLIIITLMCSAVQGIFYEVRADEISEPAATEQSGDAKDTSEETDDAADDLEEIPEADEQDDVLDKNSDASETEKEDTNLKEVEDDNSSGLLGADNPDTDSENSTESNSSGIAIYPYVTSIDLTVNGVSVDSGATVTHGDVVKSTLSYTIPGSVYASEKTYTYQLPVNVKYSAQNGKIMYGTVEAGDYSVSESGLVTFVFYDTYNTENNTIVNTFDITGTAKYNSNAADDEKKFLYEDKYKVIVVTNPGVFTVEKTAEREYKQLDNESTINYSVTISSELGTNEAFTITDAVAASGSINRAILDSDSFVIKDAAGNTVTGYTLKVADDQKSYTIENLPALGENGKYIISYDVDAVQTVNLSSSGYVTNKVSVTSDTTVTDETTTTYYRPVNKTYRYYSTSGFFWMTRVYTNGMDLSGVTLKDTANGSIEEIDRIIIHYSSGSSETWNYNTNVELFNNTVNNFVINDNQFEFTFSDMDYRLLDYIEIYYHTKGVADSSGKTTGTNSISLTTTDDDEWSVNNVTGVGYNYSAAIDKSWLSETADHATQNWGFTAEYANLQNYLVSGKSSESVLIEDRIQSYYYSDTADKTNPYVKYTSDTAPHYGIASEIEAALRNDETGLTITEERDGETTTLTYSEAIAAGYEFTMKYYANENLTGNTIEAADSTTRVYGFSISVKRPSSDTYLHVTNVSVGTYPTHFDSSLSTISYQWRIRNRVKTLEQEDNPRNDVTSARNSFQKLVSDGISWQDDSATIAYDNADAPGKVHFFLLGSVEEGTTSITFTDILPEGLSVSDFYEDGSHIDGRGTVAVYPLINNAFDMNKWSDEARSENIKVTYDENTRKLTVTVTGIDSALELYDSRYIGVEIFADITEDLASLDGATVTATESGAVVSKTFTNTASFGELTDSADVTVNKTEKILTKSGEQSSTDNSIVSYTIDINPKALDLMPDSDTLTLTDTITAPVGLTIELIRNSIKLYEIDGTNETEVQPDILHIGDLVNNDDGTTSQSFETTIDDETTYRLEYNYRVSAANGTLGNGTLSNVVKIEGIMSTSDNTEVQSASSSATTDHGSLRFYKVDADNNALYLNQAKFKLEKYEYDADTATGKWVTADEEFDVSGESGYAFDYYGEDSILDGNTLYRVVETSAPAGYALDETPFYFIIKGNINQVRNGETLVVTSDANAKAMADVPSDITDNINILSPSSGSYFYIQNSKLTVVDMPQTGSNTRLMVMLFGVTCLLFGVTMATVRNKRMKKIKSKNKGER